MRCYPPPIAFAVVLTAASCVLPGCAPEVGSEGWCEQMAATPTSEWSLKDAGDYARSCVIPLPGKVGGEAWCKEIRQKAAADWSANDAKNYASQCLLP
jgi:hypothetical protein